MPTCRIVFCLVALMFSEVVDAQRVEVLGPQVRKYLRVQTPKVILEHIQIIDGTGAAPSADKNIVIADGKIISISTGTDEAAVDGVTIFNLRGYSVMPGIVGMHSTMFYLARPNLASDASFERPNQFLHMPFSAPRLSLANGVTTMRTTGSVEPNTDLRLRQAIEKGIYPGPHIDVTGPYLDGPNTAILQMQELTGPEDARQTWHFGQIEA
ncbi:MAG TPA: hypothetical protein VGN12_15850 [Pirellulales bacterium]